MGFLPYHQAILSQYQAIVSIAMFNQNRNKMDLSVLGDIHYRKKKRNMHTSLLAQQNKFWLRHIQFSPKPICVPLPIVLVTVD
jgi:hypothetical protein